MKPLPTTPNASAESGPCEERQADSSSHHRKLPAIHLAFLIALVLAGAGLSFWHATVQPLWMDETYGLLFAQRSLTSMFHALASTEPHLPAYFLFLRYWEQLAGFSVFAVRWPSVACFLVTGVLTFKLGRQLSGTGAGLLAGALWLLQPEGFWYGQDVRMYAPLILWSVLAVLLLLRALQRDSFKPWLFFALAELAALWTHYGSVLLIPVVITLSAVLARPSQRRRAAVAITLPIVTLLPWLWFVRHLHPPTAVPSGTIFHQVFQVGRGLLFGYGGPLLPHWVTVLGILLFGGSVAYALLKGTRAVRLCAAIVCLYVLLPLLLPPLHFLFNARYISAVTPFISLFWALLIAGQWRQRARTGPALALIPLLTGLAGLAAILQPGFHHWPDYGPAAAFIRAHEQAGQVFIDNSLIDPSMHYYYRDVAGGTLPRVLLPSTHPGSEPATRAEAVQLGQRYSGAWLPLDAVGSWDGDRVAERALNAALLQDGRWEIDHIAVRFYLTPRGLAQQHPRSATFADSIKLESSGYKEIGSQLVLALQWRDLQPLA
ncbi:MAG: glycosyltransferase family 39 protein, partial [Chloroflexi bacterium]|nr:glycosyltransferase family 39 protein [Chloroflexota bacterium]